MMSMYCFYNGRLEGNVGDKGQAELVVDTQHILRLEDETTLWK